MSERLTEDEIAGLERIVVGDDGVRPIMFPWMSRALDELRERRAADMTDEDRQALRWLATQTRALQYDRIRRNQEDRHSPAAVAALDKLLGAKP